MDLKSCSTCGVEKPREMFAVDRHAPDGLRYRCKDCHRQKERERRAERAERFAKHPRRKPKTCAWCNEKKPVSEFSSTVSSPDGLHTYCRACQKEYKRARRYGITEEQYRSMIDWTGETCWSCSKPLTSTGNGGAQRCVDHSHASGRVRGILCGNCNRGYGLVGDNLEGAAKLLLYAFQGVGDPNLAEQILGQFGITLDLSDVTEGVHIPWLHGGQH